MSRLVGIWLALLLGAILLGLAADQEESPPEPEKIAAKGCDIKKAGGYWRLTVWVKYEGGGQWRRLHYMNTSRRKTLRACDKWLHQLERRNKD